ncbi:hypothetical protein OF83DRAFT_1170937, partial [Amylostereum chailletii]
MMQSDQPYFHRLLSTMHDSAISRLGHAADASVNHPPLHELCTLLQPFVLGPKTTSHLPVEILSKIFAQLPPFLLLRNDDDGFSSISVTHVCSRWRQVAIEDPKLWTLVPLYNLKWAELFLERSRAMPVYLFDTVDTKPEVYQAATMLALQKASGRLRNIRIVRSASDPDVEWDRFSGEVLHFLSTTPLPNAEAVTIDNGDHLRTFRRALLFPLTFGQVSSRLTELHLSACTIAGPAPYLSTSLCDLSLANSRVGEEFQDLLEALSTLPNLEYLRLVHMASQYPPLFDTPPWVIAFPKLRHFYMRDHIDAVAAIKRCLVVPQRACINVECIPRPGHDLDQVDESIRSLLLSMFSSAIGAGITLRYARVWLGEKRLEIDTVNPPALSPPSAHPFSPATSPQEVEARRSLRAQYSMERIAAHRRWDDEDDSVPDLFQSSMSIVVSLEGDDEGNEFPDHNIDINVLSLLPPISEVHLRISHPDFTIA